MGLARFGNAVLGLLLADGLLSLADLALQRIAGSTLLHGPRRLVSEATLAALLATWSVLVVSPRLPKRVFAAPLLVAAWWSLGAPPLPLVVGNAGALDALGVAFRLASAAIAFLVLRAGGTWWLDGARVAGPDFRLRATIGFVAVQLAVAPPLLAAAAVFGAAAGVEQATAGFLTFHAREMQIHERRYARGDREVRLVGMMHVGEEASYRELFHGFRGTSTIVLEEGVRDEEGLLKQRFSYDSVAQALGLEMQPRVEWVLEDEGADDTDAGQPVVVNADVDVRTFRPDTLVFLEAMGAVWGAHDVRSAVAALRDFATRPDARKLVDAAQADVIEARNRQLLARIDAALADYEHVVVPWGALHLAALEAALLERGFVPVEETSRPLVHYATIVASIRGKASASASP